MRTSRPALRNCRCTNIAVNRAVSSHRPVNQRPLPVLGAAHNTRSSRHSTKSSGMWTSRPRFTLFPVTSGVRLMIGGSAGQRDRHSDTRSQLRSMILMAIRTG